MTNVHKDPRVRPVSAAEGRGYARNPHMFIDVLRIPSITEAVEEASRLLRVGIVRAMQSNPNAESDVEPAKEVRNNKTSLQTVSTRRDPVSVYSAVTKRVSKTTDDAARREPPPKPVDPERPNTVVKGWNSAKKAGPSILSKRAASNSSSVFQPAPKREKKNEIPQNEKTNTEKSDGEPSSKVETGNESERQTKVHQMPCEQDTAKLTKAQEERRAQPEVSKVVMVNGTERNQSKRKTAPSTKGSSSVQVGKATSVGETHTQKSASEIWAKAVNASAEERALKHKNTLTVGARRSGLPASWGQVSSSRGASKQPSVLSLLRKQGGLGQAKMQIPRSGANAISPVTQSVIRPPTATFNQSTMIPMPRATGLEILFVPGSEVIGGVRPNGYTVSRQGVVKPLITFNPKPKVPHKVRQTSLEKLFEAWRDNKGLKEGEALAKALRTEQEMYAAANSRVEYRAAVTVKLKEIRK